MGNQSSKQHHQINGGKPKKFVHWKSAEKPSPPGRPILIPSKDQLPDVITLKWDRPQTDGGSPIIGYIIELRGMGSTHWVRATPTLVPITEVAISGLEPGWRYQFRAIAENVVGKSDPSNLSDPLTVTLQRNAITVPHFVKELEDTTVIENERVEMRTGFLGQPPPEINWFKDGFEIFSSRRTRIVNDNESSILIIHQCAFTDEGEIKCTATNRAGHVATKSILKVVAPPKIRLPRQYEDGLIVEAGEVLRLKVALAGQPFPTITWLHEGQVINNGGRYELLTAEKNSSLKIESVKRSDRGEYTLRALNYLGEDVASFLVTVTSKPNPPGKIQITMSFGRSVTLTWTAPDDDGGCKIGNYIIEYFRLGWNVWLKASTTRQLTAKLHDLIEGSEYKFRVKAENPYGVSDPSEESDILFIPDSKRGITKPPRENVKEEKPPLPPKRKALSPIRNFLGVGKKTSRSPSPNSKALDVHLIPEFFENEDLHREMSYGTPYTIFNPKEPKRTVTFKENSDTDIIESQKSLEKPTKVSEGTQSLGLQKAASQKTEIQSTTKENESSKLSINQRFQMKIGRSPSPARRKMSLPSALEKLPVEANIDYNDSEVKPLERRDSLIIEKVQQFFKRSPSPRRKNVQESKEKTSSLEKMSDEQTQRKDSLIMEKVQNFFRKSPTLNRKIISTDSSSLPSDINVTENTSLNLLNEKSKLNKDSTEKILKISENKLTQSRENDLSLNVSVRQNTTYKEGIVNQKEIEKFKQQSDPDKNQINQRSMQPNPTIEISEPKEFSDIPKKDEAHVSSEFMLVLHPIKRSKEIEKQDSFDLELEDALSPPPVSYSLPELSTELLDLQMPPLRCSVSSTELLYERAMARFYEAVELEESEKTKQRKISEDYGIKRKRLGSIGQDERLSTERRSSLIRRFSEEVQLENDKQNLNNLKLDMKKGQDSERQHDILKEYRSEDDNVQNKEYSSDYTESTATSSNDSIEKFKSELLSRTQRMSELETYHPRRMDEGNLSPYRSPTPDQSAVILTRPMPLPDPDFVPKPILKRSSAENMLKDETIKSNFNKDKSKESNFSFTSIFKKEKSVSDLQQGKKEEAKKSIENNKTLQIDNNTQDSVLGKAPETNSNNKTTEDVQKKKLEHRQSSEEERKVVVEYYSDIVKELGGSRSKGVPIYMRGGVYSKSDDENGTEEQEKKNDKTERDLMARALEKPRMSIVERLQSVHVQNKSKLAADIPNITRTNEVEEEKPDENIEAETKIGKTEERGRQSLRRPLVLKKEEENEKNEQMKPTSRDNSVSRLKKIKNTGKKTVSSVQKRIESNSSTSKSPVNLKRQLLRKEIEKVPTTEEEKEEIPEPESRPKTPEQLLDEAQENVRSAISYITDVGLFIVACWVYIFKDVRLVIPILALLLYRQLGEALNSKIPDWMRRKTK